MFESIIKNSLKYLSYYLIPDKLYRKILFKKSTGKNLNLKNPKSFNKKLMPEFFMMKILCILN